MNTEKEGLPAIAENLEYLTQQVRELQEKDESEEKVEIKVGDTVEVNQNYGFESRIGDVGEVVNVYDKYVDVLFDYEDYPKIFDKIELDIISNLGTKAAWGTGNIIALDTDIDGKIRWGIVISDSEGQLVDEAIWFHEETGEPTITNLVDKDYWHRVGFQFPNRLTILW